MPSAWQTLASERGTSTAMPREEGKMRNTTTDWRKSALILLVVVTSGLTAAACGAGKTMVMEPGTEVVKAGSIMLQEGKSTVNCPPAVVALFRSKLEAQLYKPGGFTQGDELSLTYQFVQYNPGDQFTRWFFGGLGNAGEGSITVQAIYTDRAGKPVGKIMSEGKIGSGAFGGSIDFAVQKAAEEVVQYTLTTFR
jgi:hypothetical protein